MAVAALQRSGLLSERLLPRSQHRLGYRDERPYVPQIHADLYAGSLLEVKGSPARG
jgi:hypothetical protein